MTLLESRRLSSGLRIWLNQGIRHVFDSGKDFSPLILHKPSDLHSQSSHRKSKRKRTVRGESSYWALLSHVFKIVDRKINIRIGDLLFGSFTFHIASRRTGVDFLEQPMNDWPPTIISSPTVDSRLRICKCLLLVLVHTAVVTVYSNWWRTRLRLVVSSQSYSGAAWKRDSRLSLEPNITERVLRISVGVWCRDGERLPPDAREENWLTRGKVPQGTYERMLEIIVHLSCHVEYQIVVTGSIGGCLSKAGLRWEKVDIE